MHELEKHGYKCEAVALATVDPKDPANTDADSDVEVITAAIQMILSTGKDVIVASHSYSGIPAQAAAYAFINAPENGPRLKAIAMMCSFLYPPKTALLDALGGKPAPIHIVSDDGYLVDVGAPGPEVIFYNDVDPEEASRAKALIKTHSWRCKTLPPSAEGVGYWGIPTSYLICEKDNAIPVEFQRKMVADANDDLKGRSSELRIMEEVVDSGHSPFLSMTVRTADFVRRAAGEDVPMS